jgi:hypothetical protein
MASRTSPILACYLYSHCSIYGCRETYGPFTRNYHRPSAGDGAVTDEDTHIMARQGHSFVTADEVRVVYQHQEGEPFDAPLRDVPADGRTLGEIVVRGNIVMKEVGLSHAGRYTLARSLIRGTFPSHIWP